MQLFAGGAVTVDGVDVSLAPLQRRVVLALAEAPVGGLSTAELVDRLWDGDPPASAPASLRNSVSRIRSLLGADSISDGVVGYRLGDSVRTERARIAALLVDPDASDRDLSAALDVLDVAPDDSALAAEVERLRDALIDRRCERALLGAGPAVDDLEAWCAARPDREARWKALVASLIRHDRRREAVEAVARARHELARFGLEPGTDLAGFERLALGVASSSTWRVDPIAATRAARRMGGTPSGLDTARLVGRTGLADEAVADLVGGDPVAVVLTGPTGIGKTSLALTVSERLGLPTRFVRFDRTVPGPLAALRRELADAIPRLVRTSDGAPGADRARFLDDLVAELRLTVADGAVLILDDLHDADPLTFVLLRRLLLDEVDLPLRIIATVRDDVDWPSGLGSLIERASRHRRLAQRTVPRLGDEDIAALVASLRPDAVELASAIASRCAGNPYFATLLVRRLSTEPVVADLTAPAARTVVSHDELLRWELLDPDAMAVLEVLAVTGRDADLGVLGAAMGRSPVEVRRQVLPAVDLALVGVSGDRAWFEHDLVRSAVLEGLAPDRARPLHAMVALAAEETVVDPVERARVAGHHWLAAGSPFAGRAIPHALIAARSAVETFAFEDAAEWVESALATGPIDSSRTRAELGVLYGRSLAELSRFDAAEASFRAALPDAIEAGDDDLVARAALGATGAFTDLVVDDDAHRCVGMALDAVTDPKPRLALLARGVLLHHGAGDQAAGWADEAVLIADVLRDSEATMRAMDARSIVLETRPGAADELLDAASRMRDAADGAGLVQAGFVARMRFVRAAIELGRLEQAWTVIDEVSSWPDHRLVDLDRWILMAHRSVHAVAIGDLDEAEDLAVQGRELGVRIGVAEAKPWFALQLFGIRLRQRRAGELASLFAGGVEQTDAVSWWLAAAITLVDADESRAHELVDRFEEVVDEVRRDHLWPGTSAMYRLVCRCLGRTATVALDAVQALPESAVVFGAACTFVPSGDVSEE